MRKQQLKKEPRVSNSGSFPVGRKSPEGIGNCVNGRQEKLNNRRETVQYRGKSQGHHKVELRGGIVQEEGRKDKNVTKDTESG